MNGLFDAAKEVCEFFASRQWSFCVIGGLAVQQWGEPRVTLHVDLALLTDWGAEAALSADNVRSTRRIFSGT